MENQVFYFIYCTTNMVNGKIYVGKHKTTRLNDGYIGSGKLLKRAISKYGRENFKFEILEWFETESNMNTREAELVTEEFCLRKDTYNLCVGGRGGFSYISREKLWDTPQRRSASEKNFRKLVEAQRPFHSLSETEQLACIEKRRLTRMARGVTPGCKKGQFQHTKETKRKIIENRTPMLGARNSQYGTFWITNGQINTKTKGDIPDGWRKGRTL